MMMRKNARLAFALSVVNAADSSNSIVSHCHRCELLPSPSSKRGGDVNLRTLERVFPCDVRLLSRGLKTEVIKHPSSRGERRGRHQPMRQPPER